MKHKGLAHGKLIIFGEHVVLEGAPALAVNTEFQCCCTMEHNVGAGIVIAEKNLTSAELSSIGRRVQKNHQKFLTKQLPVAEICPSAEDFIATVVQSYLDEVEPVVQPNFKLKIESDIPQGCGMGSSAAVSCAIIRACESYFNQPSSGYGLIAKSESIRHGHSSGLDAWVCWFNQATLVEQIDGVMQFSAGLPVPPFQVVHTGKPMVSTAQCILDVQANLHRLLPLFQSCMTRLLVALKAQDIVAFHRLIRILHQHLVQLGVVPEPVAQFIELIERQGGAAKISGAGASRGVSGGMVLVWNLPAEALTELCQNHQYRVLCA